MLMKPLAVKAATLGVRAEYDMRVQRLVTDSTGRVVGILAKQYGTEVAVRARRGVVLATGSFAHNDDMVATHAPALLRRPAWRSMMAYPSAWPRPLGPISRTWTPPRS